MKDPTPQKSHAESESSDLEEGEILEYDISPSDSGYAWKSDSKIHYQTVYIDKHRKCTKSKKSKCKIKTTPLLETPQNLHRSYLRSNSDYSAREARYAALPQAYCISEENVFDNGSQENIYDNASIARRSSKHCKPLQTTYGSVEDIMTKIDKTLGRSASTHYKQKRCKHAKHMIKLENARKVDAIHREYRRRRKRKRKDSESDSESETRDRKYKPVLNSYEKDKEPGKNKTDCSIVLSDISDKEMSEEKSSVDEVDKNGPKMPKTDLRERIFKNMALLERKEVEAMEIVDGAVANDSNAALCEPAENEAEVAEPKVAEPVVDANLASANPNHVSDQEQSADEEDKDEDIELIRLRLVALTSNRRNRNSAASNANKEEESKFSCGVTVKEAADSSLGVENEDGALDGGNSEASDTGDDIDRYELMLRAEALKTALLKKHQNRIKKTKNNSADLNDVCDGNDPNNECTTSGAADKKVEVLAVGLPVADATVDARDKKPESSCSSRAVQTEYSPADLNLAHKPNENILTKKKAKKRRSKGRKQPGRVNLSVGGVGVCEKPKDDVNLGLLFVNNDKQAVGKTIDNPATTSGFQKSRRTFESKPSVDSTYGNSKIPTTQIERIIVHLGSDSSEEECTSQTDPYNQLGTKPQNEPEIAQPMNKIADYEKSVELLLSEQRRRIDMKQASPRVPPTPEAVYNHLPPSQRLEYMRLKQKIAEQEKLKRMKEANAKSDKNKMNMISPKTSHTVSSPVKKSIADTTPVVKTKTLHKLVKIDKPNVSSSTPPVAEASKIVAAVNSSNVNKSLLEKKKIITQNSLHLERLKVVWKNLKFEKMVEEKYVNEIKKLKAQQNMFEMKVNQQRLKIKKLADESKKIYEAFQKNNKRVDVIGKKKRVSVREKTSSRPEENGASVLGGIDGGGGAGNAACASAPCSNEKKESTVSKVDNDGHGVSSNGGNEYTETVKDCLEYNSPLQMMSVGYSAPRH